MINLSIDCTDVISLKKNVTFIIVKPSGVARPKHYYLAKVKINVDLSAEFTLKKKHYLSATTVADGSVNIYSNMVNSKLHLCN